MSSSSTQYRSKPSLIWKDSRRRLNTEQFYLVARLGPVVFNIKDESENIFKITLGQPSTCSCGECDIDKDYDSPCIHMMYCLIKVLRIQDTNAFTWQTSFIL